MTNVFAFKKSQSSVSKALRDLADEVEANPEAFAKAILLYAPKEKSFHWQWFGPLTLAEFIGLMEIAKLEVYDTCAVKVEQ